MKQDREFVLICVILFVSAAIIFGMISFYGPIETGLTDVIKDGVFGGYCITAIFCGGYLFINFIKNRNTIVKILFVLLFPFTIIEVVATGVVMLIPTVIMKLSSLFPVKKDNNPNKEE